MRHLLTHQAGLPAVRTPLAPGAFYDWERMIEVLAAEELWWRPGERHGYHGLTFGFLVGEVRRAPAALQKSGLEWTHRLVQEPGRLGGRYLRRGLPFAGRLGTWALAQRFVARERRGRRRPQRGGGRDHVQGGPAVGRAGAAPVPPAAPRAPTDPRRRAASAR